LTVETPYSKGNDTKSKVFWVEGCNPTSATPTATASLLACTVNSGLTDKVSVRVYNTDDDTNQTVTYTVVLGGQTKTITLADGANGNVEFGGLSGGSYTATITGDDGTGPITTNEVTVDSCPFTPATPTASATIVPCVENSGSNDIVDVHVTNTDDSTNQTVTYTIKLGGQTKTLTLADGATGNVQFGGLATGSYSATITGDDGTGPITTNEVTVGECPAPVPTQVTPVVQFNEPTCENAFGRVTVTAMNGVTYKVSGQVITGTTSFAAGSTVDVTVDLAQGFVLANGAKSTFSHTFNAAPAASSCVLGATTGGRGGGGEVLGASTTAPQLVNTGDSPWAAVIVGLTVISLTLTSAFASRRLNLDA
jgi:hypothetical protein